MARRLAAILAADVAGYSRLMHEDEEATHATFNSTMVGFVQPSVRRHAGRIVKSTGDGFIAEFASAVEAVRCALEFQEAVVSKASAVPEKRRLLFRVGIDVGDIIVEKNDIFGDHVNIAARLEQLAEPGGILISGSVRDYVRDRIACRFEDTGPRHVKNITRPIHAFAISPAGANSARVALSPPPRAGADKATAAKLQLFGAVSLRIGEQEIALRSVKSRALLGYIALNPALRESRERLVGLLWSESSESHARAVLRQVVRELRERITQAGCDGFNFGPYEIGFDAGTVDIDVADVLAAAEAGKVHPVLLERQHLAEQLLAGLEEVDPAFRVWLIAKRNMLRDSLQRALEAGLQSAPEKSVQESELAQALLNIDPTHEDACRRLMRARAAAGDVAGALRIYKTLWDLLAEDYDMEPSAETQVLVAEIKGAPSMLPSRLAPTFPPSLSDTSLTLAIRCQTLIRTFNPQHWENAERQFAEIIQAAPRFVPAYCGLVDMHNTTHIVYPGKLRSREKEQQALTLARQAVELDPSNMNAHRSLAWANAMAGQHAIAVSHVETAYELNPSDPWTHFSAALLLAFSGERERSSELVRLATEMALVPNKMHWAYLVDIHFLTGNYEQAIKASANALDGHRTVRAWRAASFAQLGDSEAAADEAQKFLQSIRAGWFGAEAVSDRAIARWLLHLYPISEAEPWGRLRDGLEKAGLPHADIEFGGW